MGAVFAVRAPRLRVGSIGGIPRGLGSRVVSLRVYV